MLNSHDRIKKIKRTVARYGLYTFSWLIEKLPYPIVKGITRAFIALGFQLTMRQKKIARESLKIAFGQVMDRHKINRIIRACFENLGRGMIELIYFMAHPKMIKEKVFFEGKEHLDNALKEGRGVVAVSAHFGNFPLMLLRLAQEGYKTNAIIRPTRDQDIEKYFLQQRTKLGLTTIYSHPRKTCVDTTIKALRNNEIVFIPLDQNFGSDGGIFVDFFGQKAATATGPVVFAKRTKSLILPMFIVREKEDLNKIIIEPAFALEEIEDDEEMVYVNVSKITQLIERYIRKYPHEWGWMHRRWKSRPVGEENLISQLKYKSKSEAV